MQLTAHFVEYLIVGALMLLWLVPFISRLTVIPATDKEWLALILPAIYFAGMVLDVLGHMITDLHRKAIRKKADEKYGARYHLGEVIEHATADVDLLAISPQLAEAAEVRTTRTRIARGAVTNALLAAALWLPTIAITNQPKRWWLSILIPLVILAITGLWGMWARWQRISFRFEIKAIANTRHISPDQRGSQRVP